jgi:hypothetical protein
MRNGDITPNFVARGELGRAKMTDVIDGGGGRTMRRLCTGRAYRRMIGLVVCFFGFLAVTFTPAGAQTASDCGTRIAAAENKLKKTIPGMAADRARAYVNFAKQLQTASKPVRCGYAMDNFDREFKLANAGAKKKS